VKNSSGCAPKKSGATPNCVRSPGSRVQEKQQRTADLARLKQDAENKAVAAKAAGGAKQVAAQTASDKSCRRQDLAQAGGKAGDGRQEGDRQEVAEKKGRQERPVEERGCQQAPGLKTRGATGATGWRDNKHGKRPGRRGWRRGRGTLVPVADRSRCIHQVYVPETISVADLAHKMAVKATEVIKALMKMGSMVTINQSLDQETAMIIVEEMGHKAFAAKLDDPDAFLDETAAPTEGCRRSSLVRRWSPSWATLITARPRCSTTFAARASPAAKRAASPSTSAPITSKPTVAW
jgi:hypothetical protein